MVRYFPFTSLIWLFKLCLAGLACSSPTCLAAQQPEPSCEPKAHSADSICSCLQSVDAQLMPCRPEDQACAQRVAYYWGRGCIYPPVVFGSLKKRTKRSVSDTPFQAGAMVEGIRRFHDKNGVLRMEEEYRKGYLMSIKSYDGKGRLREWFDYTIYYDGQPYSCFIQVCRYEKRGETIKESILCMLNGRWGMFIPRYARIAEPAPRHE